MAASEAMRAFQDDLAEVTAERDALLAAVAEYESAQKVGARLDAETDERHRRQVERLHAEIDRLRAALEGIALRTVQRDLSQIAKKALLVTIDEED